MIDYIMFSEFDIDKGAVVRVQYPRLFPYLQETELSAQMLPDGSHNCIQDATIFVARNNNNHDDENNEEVVEEEEVEDIFYYGFNMYKQKKYENIRRGARVKAIAVMSKSKTCLALKPLLSEALEIVFQLFDHEKNQSHEDNLSDQEVYDKITAQLLHFFEFLFNHINHIDMSHVPNYTETQVIIIIISLLTTCLIYLSI
jgi:hypothetical protein